MSRPSKGSASPLSSKSSSMQDRASSSSCSSETPGASSYGSFEPSPWSSPGERPESRRNSRDSFRLPASPSPTPINNGNVCTPPSIRASTRRPGQQQQQQQQHEPAPRGGYYAEPQQHDEPARPESRRSSRSRSRGLGEPGAPPPAIEQLACTPPAVSETLHPINPGLTFGSQLGRISAAGGFGPTGGFGRPGGTRVTPSSQLFPPGASGLFSDAMQGHAEQLARSNSDAGMDFIPSHRVTSTSPLGRIRDDEKGMPAGLGSLADPRTRPSRKDPLVPDRSSRTYSYEDSHIPGLGRRSPSQQKVRLPTLTRPHKLPPLHPGGA